MKTNKNKNYNRRILIILVAITVIFGMSFMLVTVSETEEVEESSNPFVFKMSDISSNSTWSINLDGMGIVAGSSSYLGKYPNIG